MQTALKLLEEHYVHVDDVADAVLFVINNKEKLSEHLKKNLSKM